MPDFINSIVKSIGDFLGSPIVQTIGLVILVYIAVLWLASAYWAYRDMQLRTHNPVLPYVAASFIIVFLPIFPLAILVYRIVRPQEKVGEVYERNLAEEALLAEVEAVHNCPTCSRRIDDEWIICPTCRTRLKRVCPNCSRLVGLDWSLCAWCGKDFERREIAAASVTELPTVGRAAPIDAPIPAQIPTPIPAPIPARLSGVRAARGGRAAQATATDPLPES
jgi:RNA polymerase subunit RPABC4/transcription elongation factor Spt4